jgi:hemolysin activation/secretion protein
MSGCVGVGQFGYSGRLQVSAPIFALAALVLGGPASAQAPSQVTPRDVRPPVQAPSAAPPVAPAPTAAPAGAETLSVTVGEVLVEGGFPELQAQTQALTAPYRNRRTTVADLYQLAARIEQAYAAAGFILVRVNPPPQDLADGGPFRLVVVDGFIEAIDLAHVPAKIRRPVSMYVKPLLGRRRLTEAELERHVLLAGQVAGARLTTALGRGTQPGGVSLVVNADYDPLSGQVSVDNHLGAAFDSRELNTQLALASTLGWGEAVYGFLSVDPELGRAFRTRAPRRVASLGVSLPIGSSGLVINPEATVSRTYPKPPEGAPATFGVFDRYVLRATLPLILRRGYGLNGGLAFEAVEERQDAYEFGITLSHDRLRIVRASLDGYDAAFGPFSLRGRAELSRGIEGLGSRTVADAVASNVPLSRPGVTGAFTKLTLDGSAAIRAPFGLAVQAMIRAQLGLDGVMPSSELFALDAPNALSSFESGATGSDAGWTVRVQVGRTFEPAAWGGRAAITPYLYGAAGQATYKTASEGAITGATDFGAGLDLRFQPRKGAVRPFLTLEFGRHNQDGLTPADDRVSVAAGVQL